jgi:hypothetical protein
MYFVNAPIPSLKLQRDGTGRKMAYMPAIAKPA